MNAEPTPYDALAPAAMAEKAKQIGIKKANSRWITLSVLGLLAGIFVAVGASFYTSVTAGAQSLPYGMLKLIGGMCFSLALIMILVGGAELFTGNMLMVMAWAERQISLNAMLGNWLIVYLTNFLGSLFMVAMVFLTQQHAFGHGAVGLNMLAIGEAKTSLGFVQAFTLGVLCNMIVCLAVWLSYSARSTTDKVMVIIPTITAFVVAGFEHSVANMFFIPMALVVKTFGSPAFFSAIQKTPADFPHLTLSGFLLGNLLPVTLGNMFGGIVLVGLVYWWLYLRK